MKHLHDVDSFFDLSKRLNSEILLNVVFNHAKNLAVKGPVEHDMALMDHVISQVGENLHSKRVEKMCEKLHPARVEKMCEQLHPKRVEKMCEKLHPKRVEKMCEKLHPKRVEKMCEKLHPKRV